MTTLGAKSAVKHVQIEATVIRADGTIEKLGIISKSGWRWRFSPMRLLSSWRISQANSRLGA